MVREVKQWSRLLIHNCYHQTLLLGACFGLLGCHIVSTYTELWDVSPSVLHIHHHLLHRSHYF